jgi:hypothetical protein
MRFPNLSDSESPSHPSSCFSFSLAGGKTSVFSHRSGLLASRFRGFNGRRLERIRKFMAHQNQTQDVNPQLLG